MAAESYETLVRLLAAPTTSGEQLHAAAIELRESFVRSEHLIGLLPGDASEVMVAGFERAAELGVVQAYLDLGLLFVRGAAPWAQFPPRDVARAIANYRAADERGSHTGAIRWVSTAYFARDADWAQQAAERLNALRAADPNDLEALRLLGYFLQQGYAFAVDLPAAVSFFTAAAALGEAPSAFELSVHYATGQGVPQDANEGQRWTFRAAELGSDRALANLGGMYATGNGVEKNAATAVDYYRRAGAAGNARAAFVAGVMLLTGDAGLPADPAAAASAFMDADTLGWDVDGSLAGMGLQRPE